LNRIPAIENFQKELDFFEHFSFFNITFWPIYIYIYVASQKKKKKEARLVSTSLHFALAGYIYIYIAEMLY
jgi:hypothetical protein